MLCHPLTTHPHLHLLIKARKGETSEGFMIKPQQFLNNFPVSPATAKWERENIV